MIKNIVPIAKKILVGVPIPGAVFICGTRVQSGKKQKQIKCGKNNQNNDSDLIFVSEESYISNEVQLPIQTKNSSFLKNRNKEIKTNDVFFVLKETVLYSLQDILINRKIKANDIRSVQSSNQKTKLHEDIDGIREKKRIKIKSIYFSNCNSLHYRLSVSNGRYCMSLLSGCYFKLLTFSWLNQIPFFVFLLDLWLVYNTNSPLYFFIKNLRIRPPPICFKYKNISNTYKVQDLTSFKSC
ncbi:hypothetical protein CLU97_2756 [Chryseobacterium sp. 7]|uniref:hypothetical protein n=1 Tax=Chryseobacterium sp. 7 TaxID=2035214 RepID=UPI000EB24ED3|nr:hypothetical protein [Chryseobacterium sp. 7]RLJ33276.1 hypothetical protein CLU97_2756 [Chryseobacterium sp. 7]